MDLGSSCSEDGSHGKVELEETDGSKQRAKRVPLSLFMDAYNLEVEEELATLATQYWAEAVWIGKWCLEQKEAWMNQVFEVQMWRLVRGPAGAVMCETRYLEIKWPHWHTLIFEGDRRVDMRLFVRRMWRRCSCNRQNQSVHRKKWGAKHECEALKEGIWLEPALALLPLEHFLLVVHRVRFLTSRSWLEYFLLPFEFRLHFWHGCSMFFGSTYRRTISFNR